MNSVTTLLYILVALACLSYGYGIFTAAKISWSAQPDVKRMPVFLANVVTSVAAVLATNFGGVVGVQNTNPHSVFQNWWNPAIAFSNPSAGTPQIIGCYIYLLGLLTAAVVWARKSFTQDETMIVSILPQLTKSLLGVIIGALAILLGVAHS